ncbi:MAG TPA: YcjX family protein, partial [Pseudomonadales bacterium]|nr:YcjX family protein [Pseudomonadales bacterium]
KYSVFAEALAKMDLSLAADEQELKRISQLYQQLLTDLVGEQGYYLAQPGRMLLPGELADTPLLTFFPLLHANPIQLAQWQQSSKDSGYHVLVCRYQEYVNQVVRPFYRDHFSGFDRQLVLVDCFSALNRGKAQFTDMTNALNNIMESFQFGRSSLLRRLFAPRIDKLLFAASKVDHVTRDQQGNVLSLLSDMLSHSQHFAAFEGCEVETMAISAIKATRHCMVKEQGQDIEVVQGVDSQTGQPVTLYPGEVPKRLPESVFWQQQGFSFVDFAPPQSSDLQNDKARFDHIRLDHLLQYLLGDKLG